MRYAVVAVLPSPMALPLPAFLLWGRFAVALAPPPVLPDRDTGELAAGFFVAPRAGEDAARAFAGAFFGIAILPKYYFF
jgi:hypothetical protein